MRLKKLQEKVKEHQEKVGEKVPVSLSLIISLLVHCREVGILMLA